MRVVIDCNVIISAARSGDTCTKVIVEAVRYHEIVLSDSILDEYLMVAQRAKHAHYRDSLLAVIEEIEKVAIVVEPAASAFGLHDPDDEVYLATALTGGAVLVTGNTRDFTEPKYGPVEVLSPRAFLGRTK
jgi:putative PIN family toxin of toxin-antitoxin system